MHLRKKVIRKIYGPVLINGQWKNRYNHEIFKLYKEMALTMNFRYRRHQWVGHVMMKDERVPKKAVKGHIEGRRPFERHRGRWLDAVNRDGKRMLKCRNWNGSAENRHTWRWRTEEAKAKVLM